MTSATSASAERLDPAPLPAVSIVIPAYRSDRTVAACLAALARQSCRDYEVVLVDVGRMDRNLQIPGRYGITDHLAGGVPALLVVDPKTDKLLDGGHISALEDARNMTPQALADWLAQWTR